MSLGAPGGLFLVQSLLAGRPPGWHELARDRAIYLYVLLSTLLVFSAFGAVLGRQADRLAALSGEDVLTGLLNAHRFHERLTQELAFAERYQLPLSLIVLEVKAPGEAADDRGPEAARFLRSVAGALRAGSRAPDVPARLDGSRFALLAPCTSASTAAPLAERLSLAVRGSAGEGAGVRVGLDAVGPGTIKTPHAMMDAAISNLEPVGAAKAPETADSV